MGLMESVKGLEESAKGSVESAKGLVESVAYHIANASSIALLHNRLPSMRMLEETHLGCIDIRIC